MDKNQIPFSSGTLSLSPISRAEGRIRGKIMSFDPNAVMYYCVEYPEGIFTSWIREGEFLDVKIPKDARAIVHHALSPDAPQISHPSDWHERTISEVTHSFTDNHGDRVQIRRMGYNDLDEAEK